MPTNQELLATLSKTLDTNATMASDNVLANGYWPTGIMPMDALLGGGFQKGRMALLAGESATLKSMIGLAAAGQVLKAGGTAAIIDTEHAFNQRWAENMGIDINNLIISRPETAEAAIDQMEILVRNDIDYLCLDSIAALLPRTERDIMLSGKDNVQPARIAAVMAIGLRKLNSANEKTTIVWISQMRDNIGAMAFSPKSIITGGKSIHYYVSQSVKLTKVGKINADIKYYDGEKNVSDKQIVMQKFKAELSKSRNIQPFGVQHFNFDLQAGTIDHVQYLVQQGLDLGIINRPNKLAWELTLIDPETGEVKREEKASGQEKFRDLLLDNPDVVADLSDAVAVHHSLDPETYR